MGCGGRWGAPERGFLDRQIDAQIAAGIHKDAARLFVLALQFGGCTTAEALEIIRDRDCARDGTGIELWDAEEVPTDRWFRNAWTRSANGGPISINLKRARPIQWNRIREAIEDRNKLRLDRMLEPLEIDLWSLKPKIMAARDEIELRQVWPRELR